jgi:acyl-CoA thioester hydrolase
LTAHHYQTRVYYADTDAGGVVYHAKYLDIAERARTEALRDAGLPHGRMLEEHDCQFMVRRVNLEYFRPARLDDRLVIATRTLAMTAATITLEQEFTGVGPEATGGLLARLEVQLACVRASTGRAVRIPAPWRAA